MRLLGGEIGGAEQAEPVDQQHLLVRRAADQPAILELGGGERAHQPGFAARDARNAALDEQAGGDHARPGGDPVEPGRRLVGVGVEMAGAARQRVEQGRAIAGVAARQDVGRIGGPEEDPLAPQFGRPGLVGAGCRGRSASGRRSPRRAGRPSRGAAAAARSRSQEKPCSCSATAAPRAPTAAKSRSASDTSSLPQVEAAGEQRIAARAVAGDMVARDGDQLAAAARPCPNRRESSEPSASLRTIVVGRRAVVAHPAPRSAAILAA